MKAQVHTCKAGSPASLPALKCAKPCRTIHPTQASFRQFAHPPLVQKRNATQRSSVKTNAAATSVGGYDSLLKWCIENFSLPVPAIEPATVDSWTGEQKPGLVASRDTRMGEVLLEIPGDLGVTNVDVDKNPALATLAEGRSELVGLALWLMNERSKGSSSSWAPLLDTLPEATPTPILWDDTQRSSLLKGSTVLQEARSRQTALQEEWAAIATVISTLSESSSAQAAYPSSVFNEQAFMNAMSVVLAHASYLPSAQCFALLPLVGGVTRTGSVSGAVLDYDLDRQSVTLVAQQNYIAGQEVKLYDGRPNGELLLATGDVEPTNPSDYLTMPASLLAADRMYSAKREVLISLGFDINEEFPIYEDRIATQQLAYLRLARISDIAQMAKVSFEEDVIISQENEYEILQIMMGDLRERFQGYATEYEEDLKDLQRRDLTAQQRLAIQLKFCEKRILRGTMDGVRRRLAPIRGIPTKQGFQDPNADFIEIFDTLESIPKAPKKLLDGIMSWAKGEQDPDWNKK